MEWTQDQKKVIDTRKGTLLVSAAAGSGKTAVLVQRILSWIVEDGKNIDEFLIVTYTRAAADQMKRKIREALETFQEQQPDNQHIIKQLSLIHRAKITTIDSFCKEIVNEYFQVLEIDPSMRIMDETEGKLLQEDVLERILEQAYKEKGEELLSLHQYMNDMRSDENIRSLIKKIQRLADSFPDPGDWLERARNDVLVSEPKALEHQPWMRMIVSDVRRMMAEVEDLPRRIYDGYLHLESDYRPNAYEKYLTYFQEECRLIQEVKQAEVYTDLQTAFDDSHRIYKRMVFSKSGVPEFHYLTDDWERYHTVKKEAANLVKTPIDEIVSQQRGVSAVLLTILDLTEMFIAEYAREKQKKNCMDFGDVEHYALQVLTTLTPEGERLPSEAAEQLQRQFVEILIDEYQDSNDLQEAILTSIAGKTGDDYNNLFMVGDLKQSIYQFRMAKPRLFQDKYEKFSDDLTSLAVARKIELKQNFRSRATVLDAVNALFYQLMTKQFGGIAYDEHVALTAGRVFPPQSDTDYRTEMIFLDAYSTKEGNGNEETADTDPEEKQDGEEKIAFEARLTAKRIHELCDGREPLLLWDEKDHMYRPCRYRDIVILFRTAKGWSEIYSRELSDAGIPVYAESGRGYFDSVEVKNLLCMLAVIDNARDDIALAGALRSPMVGITDEELAWMRSVCRYGDLWSVLQTCLQLPETDAAIKQKLGRLVERIDMWKQLKTYSTIRELIWSVLDTTGYYEYVGAMPNGERRRANLLKLIEKASAYEKTAYRGLFDFLRYIERMKVTEQDFGEAVVLGANDNVVRVMTIHKSKGLEFPVVFLCGCGKQFNQKDAEDTVLVDADCYLGINYKHLDEHYFERTVKRNCIARHIKEENLAEELRILYVAMTRAKEKLIMTGCVDKQTAVKNEEYQYLLTMQDADDPASVRSGEAVSTALPGLGLQKTAKAKSYFSWLISCLYAMVSQKRMPDCMCYSIVTPEALDSQVVKEVSDRMVRKLRWEERVAFEGTQETRQTIYERFFWNYPHAAAATMKGKLSVSEIKKMSQTIDEPEQFLAARRSVGDNPSGAAYGTFIHLIMEHVSFVSAGNEIQLADEMQAFVERQILKEEDLPLIPIEKIERMLRSELGRRMAAAEQAGKLYRERQFVIGIPMNQIYMDSKEEDLELVQGIIDAYFEEDGELVLLDYKTDHVSGQDGEMELIRRYHTQLDYYKKTLEQLTGKTVKESYLYSFALDRAIRLPDSDLANETR